MSFGSWPHLEEAQQLVTADLLPRLGHNHQQGALGPLFVWDAYHCGLNDLRIEMTRILTFVRKTEEDEA